MIFHKSKGRVKLKKVGIITIQSIVNYGNRLQNYAVERLIEKRNISVETIKIAEPILWGKIYLKAYLYSTFGKKAQRNSGYRTINFLKFNERYLHIKSIKAKKAKEFFEKYDYVFLGGDQLWAYGNKDYGIEGYRFGSLVKPEKRVPFGVSFGSEFLPDEYEQEIKPWLNELKYLAIREQSGADIIERLTYRKAEVLLDPVFGLNSREWDELIRNRNQKKFLFALGLFLGKCSDVTEKIILDISANMKLVRIDDFNNENSKIGPDEFVGQIKDAEIVYTDSFHCAAFAIIFHKPFVVFKRESWNEGQMTRLNNMLEIFGLKDRIYNKQNKDWFSIDYGKVDEILEIERDKINKYLDFVLGDIKNGRFT